VLTIERSGHGSEPTGIIIQDLMMLVKSFFLGGGVHCTSCFFGDDVWVWAVSSVGLGRAMPAPTS